MKRLRMRGIINRLFQREDFFHLFSFSLCTLSFIIFVFTLSIKKFFSAFCFFQAFFIQFSKKFRETVDNLGNEMEWEEKENRTIFYKVVKQFNEKYYFIYCGFIVFSFILPYFSFLSNQNIVFFSFFVLIMMWIQLDLFYLQVKKEDKRERKEQKERWIQEMIRMERAMIERKICDTEDVSSFLPYPD